MQNRLGAGRGCLGRLLFSSWVLWVAPWCPSDVSWVSSGLPWCPLGGPRASHCGSLASPGRPSGDSGKLLGASEALRGSSGRLWAPPGHHWVSLWCLLCAIGWLLGVFGVSWVHYMHALVCCIAVGAPRSVVSLCYRAGSLG